MRDDAEDETGPLEAVALFWTENAVVEAAEDEEVEEDNEAAVPVRVRQRVEIRPPVR